MKLSTSNSENASREVQKPTVGARATDSARLMKFTKELSGTTVILGIVIIFLEYIWIIAFACDDSI